MFSLFRKDVAPEKQSRLEECSERLMSASDSAAVAATEPVAASAQPVLSATATTAVPEAVDRILVSDQEPTAMAPSRSAADPLPSTSPPTPTSSAASASGTSTTPPAPAPSVSPDASSVSPPDRDDSWLEDLTSEFRVRNHRVRGKRLAKPAEEPKRTFTGQQRLLLLDSWRRSGLPAGDFASLVGISKHTLYLWNKQFERQGPEGLMDQPKGARPSSRIPEVTKRAILMLKQSHPEWGCQRISDMLLRGPALPACASSVARVLREAGYELVEERTCPHPQKDRRFERAKPNQLWQTDLFTFMLKRQNRRVYLVAFMDDHSRFLVSYGLHASASTAMVLEALEAGISSYGPPEEILTDNGPQYITWRGKSQFSKRLEQRGIRQIVARPKRPQTLGKVERFWGTLWREFLESAVFTDLQDARTRIGLFIDYHNFQRVHRGIDGLVPADRFFGAASEVARTLKQRVSANALELARHGQPKTPFYVTGQMDGQSFSLHAEGPRLILSRPGQLRQEVELTPPSPSIVPGSANEAPALDSVPASSLALNSVPQASSESAQALPTPICPHGSSSATTNSGESGECSLEHEGSQEEPSAEEQTGGDA